MKREITDFIIDNDIVEYYDLIYSLHKNQLYDLEDLANSQTIFFNTFISSKRNKILKQQKESSEELPIIYKE